MDSPTWFQGLLGFVQSFLGPAILILLSGVFSISGLVLRGRDKAREAAERKQAKADQIAQDALDRENELKDRALKRAEEQLDRERQQSAQLIADKIHHLSTKMQAYENEIGIYKMKSQRDELVIQQLNEAVSEFESRITALKQRLNEKDERIRELEQELDDLRRMGSKP